MGSGVGYRKRDLASRRVEADGAAGRDDGDAEGEAIGTAKGEVRTRDRGGSGAAIPGYERGGSFEGLWAKMAQGAGGMRAVQ